MRMLWSLLAVVPLATATLAQDQRARTAIGNADADACSLLRQGDGFAVSMAAPIAIDDGIDLTIDATASAMPVVTAHAINTKGTSATNHRSMPRSCAIAPSPEGTLPSGPVVTRPVPSCTVSGDPETPLLRVVVPLSAFDPAGTAKQYVGHVTLIKQRSDAVARAGWSSKKGYDYYKASSARIAASGDLTYVSPCDASALSSPAPGRPAVRYDLAVSTSR